MNADMLCVVMHLLTPISLVSVLISIAAQELYLYGKVSIRWDLNTQPSGTGNECRYVMRNDAFVRSHKFGVGAAKHRGARTEEVLTDTYTEKVGIGRDLNLRPSDIPIIPLRYA